MIYEDERIKVTETGSKVRITNKFAPYDSIEISREAFEKMCCEVANPVQTADIWE